MIVVYRVVKAMKTIYRDDLFVWNTRKARGHDKNRGHDKKLMKTRCFKDIQETAFPIDLTPGMVSRR